RLNLRDMRAHAREAQGPLAHSCAAREAGAETNHQASRRELLKCCDGRSLSHRVAIARDQHRWAKFDAVRLFGDAGESDPYVVAEGGNLGAPDRPKAEVFCQKRILSGSRTGRQAEVISQHDALQEKSSLSRALRGVGWSSHCALNAARDSDWTHSVSG